MGKKLIVSVTYENERTSIKNSLPYLKFCVTSLLCSTGPNLWPFYGFLCKFLNIYAHTAKIQGTFRVNHIAKDREGLLSVLSGKIQLRIGVINRMPVKTFHVRWIVSSNLTRLPVQQKIAGFSPSDSSHSRE